MDKPKQTKKILQSIISGVSHMQDQDQLGLFKYLSVVQEYNILLILLGVSQFCPFAIFMTRNKHMWVEQQGLDNFYSRGQYSARALIYHYGSVIRPKYFSKIQFFKSQILISWFYKCSYLNTTDYFIINFDLLVQTNHLSQQECLFFFF